MKTINICAIIMVWVCVAIAGILSWETKTDMIQGFMLGVILTGCSLAADGISAGLSKIKVKEEYYIKF